MSDLTLIAAPGPAERTVRTAEGLVHVVPTDWSLLPPGDAGLTRRVKAAGPSWTVQEKKGRKLFSRGVWAPTVRIETIRAELAIERSTDAYAKRMASSALRREHKQTEYVEDFCGAVVEFLRFAPRYAELAVQLAEAVTQHATPVGSGTVARTERIPIDRRAESAVIAWLRHQTTGYDEMKIARVKGQRREVRRMLAEQSRAMLNSYRTGAAIDPVLCPLRRALTK